MGGSGLSGDLDEGSGQGLSLAPTTADNRVAIYLRADGTHGPGQIPDEPESVRCKRPHVGDIHSGRPGVGHQCDQWPDLSTVSTAACVRLQREPAGRSSPRSVAPGGRHRILTVRAD